MQEFTLSTTKKQEVIDITHKVEDIVKKSKVKNGLCHVFTPHATSALILNENSDPHVMEDFLNAINKAIPDHAGYKHDKVDNNAGAHIKASIIGASETIPINDNSLSLGTWQNLMFLELDGPRENRRIIVSVIKNA